MRLSACVAVAWIQCSPAYFVQTHFTIADRARVVHIAADDEQKLEAIAESD